MTSKRSFRVRGALLILGLLVPVLTAVQVGAAEREVRIGVLAKRGAEQCLAQWSPTADYLSAAVPEYTFRIVPLGFDVINHAVEQGEVDFVLANSAIYVELEALYDVARILTLKNLRQGGAYTLFGGVIFTRADRTDIRNLRDLRGRSFMAVEENSFGGWIMAWRELKENGISPFRDFSEMRFGGTHDAVVYAVRDGRVAAGTVRTDTLERMAAEGKIRMRDFRVIHGYASEHKDHHSHEGFPFLHSTRLYPEWPIARLLGTPDDLARKVAVALLNMPAEGPAARAGKIAGWTLPLSYHPVHDCLKELRLGPYREIGKITLADVIRQYWYQSLLAMLGVLLLGLFALHVQRLNRRLRQSKAELEQARTGLETRVMERTRDLARANRELQARVRELKRSREALLESENSYRALSENLPGLVYRILLREGRKTLFFNDMLVPMTGYSDAELCAGEVCSIDPLILNQDRPRVVKAVERAVYEDRPFELEYRIQHHNGEVRHFYERGRPVRGADGEPLYIDGVILDVTERRRTEAFAKRILETIDEGLLVVDRDFRILSANQAFCNQMKKTLDAVVGRPCYEVTHHRDRPCDEAGEACAVRRTLETGGSEEVLHEHSDEEGKALQIEIRSYPMKDPAGRIFSVIETLTDVTEKKSLEAQLLHSQKMEAVGQLAGGIAHDFNNILTAVMGHASIVQDLLGEDHPLRPDVDQILASSERAAELTRSLLTFSRRQEINPKPVRINQVVQNVKQLLSPIIGEHIRLHTSLASEEITLVADPGQIEQVLMNLCTNARDAMPQGGTLSLETRVERLDRVSASSQGLAAGDYMVLSVSDTGEGIDPGIRERIFDPFFTTKEVGKGTGLGLAMVYGIVRQHKGHIRVSSEPGRGTSFAIYLPAMAAEGEGGAEAAAVPAKGGQEMVLVAEDGLELRRLITRVLGDKGYRVLVAEDGEEAVERFREDAEGIDLLILDVIMPRKTGKDVLDEIRRIRPHVKAFFISGYAENMVRDKGVADAGIDLLAKPFSPETLLRKVREVLDGDGTPFPSAPLDENGGKRFPIAKEP